MFGNHTPAATTSRSFMRGDGMQWKFKFDNGFGASVINDGYGGDEGLYEVAVLDNGHLTCDTPITDDVLGYLTEQQVVETLDAIAALARVEVSA